MLDRLFRKGKDEEKKEVNQPDDGSSGNLLELVESNQAIDQSALASIQDI